MLWDGAVVGVGRMVADNGGVVVKELGGHEEQCPKNLLGFFLLIVSQ